MPSGSRITFLQFLGDVLRWKDVLEVVVAHVSNFDVLLFELLLEVLRQHDGISFEEGLRTRVLNLFGFDNAFPSREIFAIKLVEWTLCPLKKRLAAVSQTQVEEVAPVFTKGM